MTSSTTTRAAANGGTTSAPAERTEREHGLLVLRNIEARALIHLANDAISETSAISHRLHTLIFDGAASDTQLRERLEESLMCWQTADHYLRMLASVLEEREYGLDPQSIGPVL